MRQAHEEVIVLHGIPVEGKGMLVVVALMFFDEEARFDAPALASTEVAALMDIVLAVESVEQEQDPQAGEAGLEALAQARKGAQFAILLLRLGFAQGLFEELAEQRDDQAVVEGQAGLKDVDEVLSVTGFVLADGTLQEFLRPEGVASELL
jgi:hypothetical protein